MSVHHRPSPVAAPPAPSSAISTIIAQGSVRDRVACTAVDGSSRLVCAPRRVFEAEPKGDRFDCFLTDCGEFVFYREPLASSG